MPVPLYHRSRRGRMFRIQRVSEGLSEGRTRFVVRAFPVSTAPISASGAQPVEAFLELTTDDIRDKIQRRQTVPPPEHIFDRLWQQVRVEVDAL